MNPKKVKILGQDPAILIAMKENIVSWAFSLFKYLFFLKLKTNNTPRILPSEPALQCSDVKQMSGDLTKCVSIAQPGGMDELRVLTLQEGVCTVGYNLPNLCPSPYTPIMDASNLPSDCVILRNMYFSVNYADVTIRWGLYESAKRFVGWPIVPGFDVAGVIEAKGKDVQNLNVGDAVFGCSLFGAYSSRIVVPAQQLRRIPESLTLGESVALPAVSLTALYALHLANYWPLPSKYKNQAILIHSCAGGVGSMLVQMAKVLKLCPVVGVVGRSSKVEAARNLGCDVVIDKSNEDLWAIAEKVSPSGYSAIFDANGVTTLQDSYNHLAPTGRLVVYGFHTNLPSNSMLSPIEWLKMAVKMMKMPLFNPMDLTVDNKCIMGFNLSFFADERDVLMELFDQLCEWLNDGKLVCPNVVELPMSKVGDAHALIQSGKSIGKIILSTE